MDSECQSVAASDSRSKTPVTEKEEECSVCVVVNIRPLISNELVEGCRECLEVDASQAQVSCYGKNFLFDKVYGSCSASPPENLFPDCIQPLVDMLFKGYNATVLAYGQTGSGKTYTMGSAFCPGQQAEGVIPSVLDQIFDRIKTMPLVECTVRASFVEIHKEEIRDLLVFGENQAKLNRTTSISVRETSGGGVCLAGATEREVTSKEQTGELLALGSQFRATASTNMNSRSSRSHAIFTITLEQRKQVPIVDSQKNSDDEDETVMEDEVMDDFLTAKMHLVDLAGSERAKRTKAEGQRLKEGIDINKGLLALGKVISSLVEHHHHVPYRDSKLTRLLQDSLGGNSRTVMIACVSPADINKEESTNTLRYANQARKIKNKPVVNRDPIAAQFAYYRQKIAALQSELAMYKRAGNGEELQMNIPQPYLQEELDASEKRRKLLEDENARLKIRMESASRDAKDSRIRQVEAQRTCDKFKISCSQLKNTLDQLQAAGISLPDSQEGLEALGSEDVIQGYLERIAELEQENRCLKDLKAISKDFHQRASMGNTSARASLQLQRNSYVQIPELEEVDQDLMNEQMAAAEEEEYRLEHQRLGEELSTLQKSLELKELQIMKVTASSTQVEALRLQFEKHVRALETKRTKLERERQELSMKLQNLKAMSHEEQLRMEEHYRHQLREKDEELKELKKKEKEFMKLEKLKRKTEDACSKLKSDIERIKAQKVKLLKQIEVKNKEHNDRMKSKEREMMQLKKQNRVAQAKLQKIEALHSKQQTVLRRKTEEAEAARRRLKELSVSNKNRRPNSTDSNASQGGPMFRDDKSRFEWLEQELDGCNQSLVLKRVLDGEFEQRKHSAWQLNEVNKRLEHIQEASKSGNVPSRLAEIQQTLLNRKAELDIKIAHHSAQIAEVQKAYDQARMTEERTGAANDIKRWNGLRTVTEARGLLKTLFKIASDQKVQAYEMYNENSTLMDESTELKEKLDIMAQEIQALRTNLVRAEAAAVAAVSISSKFGPTQQAQDNNDSKVEHLLQQINDVATTPNRRKTINVMLREQNRQGDYDAMEEDDGDKSGAFSDSSNDSDWYPDEETNHGEDYEASPNGKLHRKKPANHANKDEKDVLHFINVRLARRGEACAQRLTIPVMERELKLSIQNWQRGRKTRDVLIDEIKTRLMVRGTDRTRSPSQWGQDNQTFKINISDNIKCTTPQAREFLKRREDMMHHLEWAKARGRRSSSLQPQESPAN